MNRFRIALTAVVFLVLANPVFACPVCFGNPNSAQMKGARAGILALLLVTVSVLASIAGFFFIYLRRRIRMFEESESNERELLDVRTS
jgi:hypothetical protein